MKQADYCLDIVILAGGPSEPLEEGGASLHRSLISINGKTVMEHIVSAIRASSIYRKLIIIGSEDLNESAFSTLADHYLPTPPTAKLSENVCKAIRFSQATHVLIVAGDIPTIRTDILEDLAQIVHEYAEKDLLAFVVTKDSVEASFPGSHRTYGKIKEGRAKVGNVLAVKKEAMDKLEPLIERFTKNRKSVIKLAFSFGIWNVIKLAVLKNISIPQLEKAFEKSTGISAKGILVPYGELAVDIDKPSDLKDIEAYFRKRS